MRILIVDDTEIHHMSADQCFAGHEIVHVRTQDKAISLLQRDPTISRRELEAELDRHGLKWAKHGTPEATAYNEKWKELTNSSRPAPFDVACLDLLMPAGKYQQRPDSPHVGQLMPVGFPLALFAARSGNAKQIIVATATNHHDHPMAGAFDLLSARYEGHDTGPDVMNINGATVGFFQADFRTVEGTTCGHCLGNKKNKDNGDCGHCQGTGLGEGKDWRKMLARLTGKHEPSLT